MAVQPTHCGMYRKPKLSLRSQCVGSRHWECLQYINLSNMLMEHDCWSYTICQTWLLVLHNNTHVQRTWIHKMCTKSPAKVSQVHSSCRETACLCASPRYARTTRQARLLSSVTNNYIPNCNNTQLSTVYLTIDNKPTVEYISNCRQHAQCWPHTQLSTKKNIVGYTPNLSFFLQPSLLNNFDSTWRPLLVRWLVVQQMQTVRRLHLTIFSFHLCWTLISDSCH